MYLEAFQQQLLPGHAADRSHRLDYASRFERWDDRAGVRRKPRRSYEAGGGPGLGLFFPPELYPVALHPLVAARGETTVHRLLLQRLYDYLAFTTELESVAVIPVAIKISRSRSGLPLPEHMQADAFKIVTDEAWHAQFSDDFARQVAAETGCASQNLAGTPPAFLPRLDELRDRLPAHVRGVESLLFAIVSETLISGILAGIPRDGRLPQSVREVVRDHAEDEGRHHVYFRSMLRHLWSGLTPRERRAIGPLVPSVIYAFLEPDYARAADHLAAAGLSAPESDQVIAESWPSAATQAEVAEAASPLVRYLQEAGVFEDARTHEAFESSGLLDAGPSSRSIVADGAPLLCTPKEFTR
ncbi:diiron oxygenase [Streptomyces sp. NPDC050211]|uniref:diiron oxygenase n=1 Tax=Streptomyces sp. NPDC050211 TaxID=3154932 RepID=UPI0034242ADE